MTEQLLECLILQLQINLTCLTQMLHSGSEERPCSQPENQLCPSVEESLCPSFVEPLCPPVKEYNMEQAQSLYSPLSELIRHVQWAKLSTQQAEGNVLCPEEYIWTSLGKTKLQ